MELTVKTGLSFSTRQPPALVFARIGLIETKIFINQYLLFSIFSCRVLNYQPCRQENGGNTGHASRRSIFSRVQRQASVSCADSPTAGVCRCLAHDAEPQGRSRRRAAPRAGGLHVTLLLLLLPPPSSSSLSTALCRSPSPPPPPSPRRLPLLFLVVVACPCGRPTPLPPAARAVLLPRRSPSAAVAARLENLDALAVLLGQAPSQLVGAAT